MDIDIDSSEVDDSSEMDIDIDSLSSNCFHRMPQPHILGMVLQGMAPEDRAGDRVPDMVGHMEELGSLEVFLK